MLDPMQPGPRAADTGGVGLSANSFADVYVEHMPEIIRYCRSILRDASDAEDAAQSAMERALRALTDGPAPEKMRPWLFTIAQREALTLLRKRRRSVPTEIDEGAFGPQGSAEELAAVRERLAQLLADVRELSPRQREGLVARELGGRSYRQIAASLGTSEAAAQQLVLDARQSLRVFEAGRSLECHEVRSWISAHEHARLRTRRVSAHLRSCDGCRGFRHAIVARRRDFALLLPGLGGGGAVWPWLATLLGGGKLVAAGAVAVTGAALVTWAPLADEHPNPAPAKATAVQDATATPAPILASTSTRLGARPARASTGRGRSITTTRRRSARRESSAPIRPGRAPVQPAAATRAPDESPTTHRPATTPAPSPTAAPPSSTATPTPDDRPTPPALDPVLDTVDPVLDTIDEITSKLPPLPQTNLLP